MTGAVDYEDGKHEIRGSNTSRFPNRIGESVGVVIPTLLAFRDTAVVLDVKSAAGRDAEGE